MHYSKEEKAILLEEWRESGKSISAYVKEKGLVRWTFHKWLKAERAGTPCFVEVTTQAIAPLTCKPEIRIEKGGIKIHIPLSVWVEYPSIIAEGLKAVL
jgi:transposase-like protein